MRAVAQAEPGGAGSQDAVLALRNAAKLGLSQAITWSVALGVRLLLPRYLGPAAYGPLNFADIFAATVFVLLGLGMETYIRKEIPVRPELANAFFGGLVVLRVALTVALLAVIAVVLNVTDRPPEMRRLVYLFGIGQFFFGMNGSLSGLLHSRGTVDGLSVVNVASKVLWGLGILAGALLGFPVAGVAVSFIVSEAAKCVALWVLSRRHLGLQFELHWASTRSAILAGLPFYVGAVAYATAGRLDVTMLEFMTGNAKELGWYGAASNLATLTLLVVPVIGWVLMPLYARALHRSEDEMLRAVARSVELILVVAIPASLGIVLGADLWVRLVFGKAFAPAALSLQIMSPVFVLTYVATVSGLSLNLMGRGWTVTRVCILGVLLTPTVAWFAIPLGARHLGGALHEGGAGAGAALSNLTNEIIVTIVMAAVLRFRVFDRRSLDVLGRTLVVCALVVGLHVTLARLGHLRLLVDAVAYVALAFALRAVRWREMVDFARLAWKRS
jgi:O-antigen/teichoic acid export membrane protein